MDSKKYKKAGRDFLRDMKTIEKKVTVKQVHDSTLTNANASSLSNASPKLLSNEQ